MRFKILLITILFAACQNDHDGYALQGNIDNLETGKMIYISQIGENNQPQVIDSIPTEDGKFSVDLPNIDKPNLRFLSIPGYNGQVLFISENETINFEIYKDSLPASRVTGGTENKIFNDYLGHLKGINNRLMDIRRNLSREITSTRDSATVFRLQREEESLRVEDIDFKKNMIRKNPDAFASVLALTDLMSTGVTSAEIREHYNLLNDDLKETPFAKTLITTLDKNSAVEIGSKAPEFSGPNPQGEEIALKDLLGKVTLIDFWAAWCKPCRDENPNIVRVYNKYHEQGFNAIGVSLDREDQRDRWLQAIDQDGLTWPQISNLQFWNEPIAQLYSIRAIPAAFLLDENGVIVAKDLRGPDLERTVKMLLEK
ncbi:TlpA disulfide reductase family protein [soil metagenome]